MDAYTRAFVLMIVAVMAGITVTHGQDCPRQYLRYSSSHSYCIPKSPSCNILATYVTPEEISIILREHNNYRSKVATGKDQLPSATNMLQMEWDDELAAVAQKRAEQCQFSHDRPSQRRVQNFGAGQNLAIEAISNSPSIPTSNWPSAIKSWYDERAYFKKTFIDPFIAPSSGPTYGHFSQLVWADSWRLGCGYVLYQEGTTYKKLYVCNYGPAGNMLPNSMYKMGPICSACPVNSCCDKTCQGAAEYAGLCKMTDGRAPIYKKQETYLFYCDFSGQDQCAFTLQGENAWKSYTTLSGNYLGIVLNGGQSSTITFMKYIKPASSKFCFTINYRKGADVDGQVDSNSAEEKFTIPSNGFTFTQSLPSYSGDEKHQFAKFTMALSWSDETQLSLTFSVPRGASAQFFEIKDISAQDGDCKN